MILIAVGAYLQLKPTVPVTPPAPPSVQKKPELPPKPVPPPVARNYSVPKKVHQPQQRYPEITAVPEGAPVDSRTDGRTGRLAIVIDDMGSSLQEARSLAGISVPLTFSIIPGLRSYRDVAAFAASKGIETMIHIPMQSKEWPGRRLESNGLLVSMADDVISGQVDEYMKNLPGAVGANNHTGSEFTEHEDKMRVVLTALKSRGLFFVDSVTSPRTAGIRLAQELGMKNGRRGVFLDNEQNEAYIRGQLAQAVRLSKKTGGVIAICHPHPATIRTLEAVLPGLAKQGIVLVPASQLVR
jgi:polysaccharide deacetylase 2 family uncharacterized protein YibQ